MALLQFESVTGEVVVLVLVKDANVGAKPAHHFNVSLPTLGTTQGIHR